MHIIYLIIFIPPPLTLIHSRSTLYPLPASQLHIIFQFFYNPLHLICTTHIFMGAVSSTRVCSTYLGPQPPPNPSTVSSSSVGGGACESLPFHVGMLTGLILFMSYVGNHRCWQFTSSLVLSCSGDTILPHGKVFFFF